VGENQSRAQGRSAGDDAHTRETRGCGVHAGNHPLIPRERPRSTPIERPEGKRGERRVESGGGT
jgi:hypothetical protein